MAGSHGSGVSIVESKRGLRSIIDLIVRSNAAEPVMVQEYVKESKGKDVRVHCWQTDCRARWKESLLGAESLGHPSSLAAGFAWQQWVARKRCGDLRQLKLGLDIAGVDLIRTKTGPKVLEVNANPGLEGIKKQPP